MAQKAYFFTPEGLTKLESELESLRTVRRPEVAEKIKRAKELGGTENNAEYDDAKNEQSFIEGRILTLENMIQNATVIRADAIPSGQVKLGSKVITRNQDGKEENYIIVGRAETNPDQGKISDESPVGQALMGKKVGDKVKIVVPAGVLKLTILGIE